MNEKQESTDANIETNLTLEFSDKGYKAAITKCSTAITNMLETNEKKKRENLSSEIEDTK